MTDDEMKAVATIAAEYGRDHRTMTATTLDDGLVRVSYARPDGDRFAFDVRVELTRCIWRQSEVSPGGAPGRWRDLRPDGRIDVVLMTGSRTAHVTGTARAVGKQMFVFD